MTMQIDPAIISIITMAIEGMTLIVLSWTLIEIARTRRIDAQQKDLQLLPAMIFIIRNHSGTRRLFIRNIGFGTATSVRVQSADFVVGDKRHEYRFHLVDHETLLRPGQEQLVGFNHFIDGEPDINSHNLIADFMVYFDPESIEQINAAGEAGLIRDVATPMQRELTVSFRDLTGQEYRTTLLFSEHDISVSRPPKRVDLRWWRRYIQFDSPE